MDGPVTVPGAVAMDGTVRVLGSPVVAVQPLWLEGEGAWAPRCLFPGEGVEDVPMVQVSGSWAGLPWPPLGSLGPLDAGRTSSRAWGVQKIIILMFPGEFDYHQPKGTIVVSSYPGKVSWCCKTWLEVSGEQRY